LDRHFELLPGNQFAKALSHQHPVGIGLVAVNNGAKGIHSVTLQEDIDFDEVTLRVTSRFVVQATHTRRFLDFN
jgi:hypothetical protein